MARQAPPMLQIGNKYLTVAASQTTSALGVNGGKAGDYIAQIIVVPATTTPGAVSLFDGATTFTLFTGGAQADTRPTQMDLDAYSINGPWKISTGSNVSVVVCGEFS